MLLTIMQEELSKQYAVELIRRRKCCFCCNMITGIAYIAFYVKLRAVLLVLLSFVPPLLRKIYEKSWRYPDGHISIKPYLENQRLMMLYMFNILLGCFIQCYGVASYYTWSISLDRQFRRNRIDRDNFQRLPKVHLTFFVHLLILLAIQLLIRVVNDPNDLVIVIPDYNMLAGIAILEMYITFEVCRYVKTVKAQIKGIPEKK